MADRMLVWKERPLWCPRDDVSAATDTLVHRPRINWKEVSKARYDFRSMRG
jgi:hypothetical protein